MNTTARISLFVALYAIVFVSAMGVITNGVMDIAAYASAPIILCAEAIVVCMLYLSCFHSENHEEHAPAITKASMANVLAHKAEEVLKH